MKAVYIEAPDKSSGKRRQGIRISYDLVGFIPVDELMKQERHERSHAVPAKSNITFLRPHAIWAGRFYITILAAGEASENAIDCCIFIWHNQTPPPHFSGCNAAFLSAAARAQTSMQPRSRPAPPTLLHISLTERGPLENTQNFRFSQKICRYQVNFLPVASSNSPVICRHEASILSVSPNKPLRPIM